MTMAVSFTVWLKPHLAVSRLNYSEVETFLLALDSHLSHSAECVGEIMQDFGAEHNCVGLTSWATELVSPYVASPDRPYRIN
ncbi:MAG: hypothetical protein DMG39_12330 [Acidobacteria bacterium]|nr:MAG: hypothetical protein DMG39_12330 [Acidobacteriota bacterium]